MNHSNSLKSNTSSYQSAKSNNSFKSAKSKNSTPKKTPTRRNSRRSKSVPLKRTQGVALARHYPVKIPHAIELVYAIREQTQPNEEYLRRNAVRAGILQPLPGEALELNSRLYDPLINGQWMNSRRRTLRRTYY